MRESVVGDGILDDLRVPWRKKGGFKRHLLNYMCNSRLHFKGQLFVSNR